MKKLILSALLLVLCSVSISSTSCVTKLCCKQTFTGYSRCVEVCMTRMCPFGYYER